MFMTVLWCNILVDSGYGGHHDGLMFCTDSYVDFYLIHYLYLS